ncbi:MAG: hypothetical protein AB8F74_06890 [Saprospiraceae bacterium]
MNNIKWCYAVALLLFFVCSCGKDNSTTPVEVDQASFSCKIDGKFWETKNVAREVMIRSEESAGVFFKTLIISGSSDTEELVTLHIYNMYEAETGDCPGVYTYFGSEHVDYEEKARQITIDGIRYGDHSAISYFSSAENSSGSGFSDIEAEITSCSDFKISGTFKGTIQGQNENGPYIMRISEGVFESIPYVIEE